MRPDPGEIFAHVEDPGVYARVDSVGEYRVYFSVWEVRRPGWQGGAALHRDNFAALYGGPPRTEEYVQDATAEYWRQAEEADAYAQMVNAPLRPETIRALSKRLAVGDHPVIKVTGPSTRERWRAWWDTLSAEELRTARDTMPDPERSEEDQSFGNSPSYRCFIGRHEDCEPEGPERGCTCRCGHGGGAVDAPE